MNSQGAKIGSDRKWRQNILYLWSYSVLRESFQFFMERNFTANGRDICSNAKGPCYWDGPALLRNGWTCRVVRVLPHTKVCKYSFYKTLLMMDRWGLKHVEPNLSAD